MTGNPLAKQIVDAAYRVHTTLGPGLLESGTPQAADDASAVVPWYLTASTMKWDFGQSSICSQPASVWAY
ncbi:MAG TPA: hypothetical protein VNY05_20655 [Candidatus Acidoferrales bacterium]|nr:hypothetical protein [Candidatus Acidoferrales bacterium]